MADWTDPAIIGFARGVTTGTMVSWFTALVGNRGMTALDSICA